MAGAAPRRGSTAQRESDAFVAPAARAVDEGTSRCSSVIGQCTSLTLGGRDYGAAGEVLRCMFPRRNPFSSQNLFCTAPAVDQEFKVNRRGASGPDHTLPPVSSDGWKVERRSAVDLD